MADSLGTHIQSYGLMADSKQFRRQHGYRSEAPSPPTGMNSRPDSLPPSLHPSRFVVLWSCPFYSRFTKRAYCTCFCTGFAHCKHSSKPKTKEKCKGSGMKLGLAHKRQQGMLQQLIILWSLEKRASELRMQAEKPYMKTGKCSTAYDSMILWKNRFGVKNASKKTLHEKCRQGSKIAAGAAE